MKKNTKKCLNVFAKGLFVFFTSIQGVNSQITLKQDYTHNDPADIGTFQGINFKEYKFKYILIECRNFKKIQNFLIKKNYKFIEKLSVHDYLFAS